jgi:hypothetical protein
MPDFTALPPLTLALIGVGLFVFQFARRRWAR